jgi:tetratricopeptide (TPR) repeat protein
MESDHPNNEPASPAQSGPATPAVATEAKEKAIGSSAPARAAIGQSMPGSSPRGVRRLLLNGPKWLLSVMVAGSQSLLRGLKWLFSAVIAGFKSLPGALKSLLSLLVLLLSIWYLALAVCKHPVLIDAFTVSKGLEDPWVSGELVAEHLRDQMSLIRELAAARDEAVDFRPVAREDTPDIEVPGVGFNLKSFIQLIRSAIGVPVDRIDGDVMVTGANVQLTIRLAAPETLPYGNQSRRYLGKTDSLEALLRKAALDVYSVIDPATLATYYYNVNIDEEAGLIARRCARYRNDREAAIGYYVWGSLLLDHYRYSEAITRFQEAARRAPEVAPVYNSWGVALHYQRHYPEAIERYRRAIACDQAYARPYLNISIAQNKLRERVRAIQSAQEAIRIDPWFAPGYLALGRLLEVEGRQTEAVDRYNEALYRNPDDPPAQAAVAALQREGNKAATGFQRALALCGQSTSVHKLGLRKIELNPRSYRVAARQAQVLLKWANYLEQRPVNSLKAEAKLLQARQKDPRSVEVYLALGNFYRREVELSRPKPAGPRRKLTRALLLTSQQQDRFRKNAMKAYLKARALDPTNAEVLVDWGYALAAFGEYDPAFWTLGRAIKRDPGSSRAHLTLGLVFESDRKFKQARKEYSLVSKWEPRGKLGASAREGLKRLPRQ